MKSLLFIVMGLITVNSYAGGEGSDSGHGGGVFCISETKCITLAEAGLSIQSPQFYTLSKEVLGEVKNIVKQLPLDNEVEQKIYQRVIANSRTYMLVDTFDAKKLKAIKEEYLSLLAANNPNMDISKLMIAAVSEPIGSEYPRTFLLSNYFATVNGVKPKLDLRTQALLLIHEGNVRGRQAGIIPVALAFDSIIEDLLKDPSKYGTPEFDHNNFADVLNALELAPLNKIQCENPMVMKQINEAYKRALAKAISLEEREDTEIKYKTKYLIFQGDPYEEKILDMNGYGGRFLVNENQPKALIKFYTQSLGADGTAIAFYTPRYTTPEVCNSFGCSDGHALTLVHIRITASSLCTFIEE